MTDIHPYYQEQRPAMEASMRQRLQLVDDLLRDRLGKSDVAPVKQAIMEEFGIVLRQMPYVGGASSRMTNFFMRLLGFMAIGRVLRRHGLQTDEIGEIELESLKRQLLTIPEAERLETGRQFLSDANRATIREQATQSHEQFYPGDFVYDFVEAGPNDTFEFGVNYRACGFCKFAAQHGDTDLLPNICGLDFAAYELLGIHLERTQTLAGGASHCNFRFSRKPELEPQAAAPSTDTFVTPI